MAKKGETKSNAKPASKQKRAYNSTEKAKKERAARNKARRQALAKGIVKKGDDKDIDHKEPLRKGGSTEKSNTRVRSAKANRADNGSYKGMKRKGKRK
ncbi:MAG: hypothetical protein Unbinned96contig1001_32 [Prokaryotic dsDNA virus sp.]|nr:MAG: hypothetical protein Unbinned96contig1001_32 [Prokaryotic dsDNA virus sp.]|tara:strand:+ start:2853 stop:3146 length:294 start_codon:yes stop_codon:yes gene_type:complete